jgi:hypothetical protein
MDLNEARQILSNNGYITERASDMGDWRKWFDEYEDSHSTTPGEIENMIEDLADECDEDWRRHFSEPEYAIDLSYEELCDKWGRPEDN